jgi:two-component system alkaline phosphatase synthesis response regulator PhoP
MQSAQPGLIQSGELVIDLAGHRVLFRGKKVELTATEFRILELLATHKGRAFSRDEIIDAALQSEDAITERTVDAHIVGIRKALGPAGAHIETVRTIGYCFLDS